MGFGFLGLQPRAPHWPRCSNAEIHHDMLNVSHDAPALANPAAAAAAVRYAGTARPCLIAEPVHGRPPQWAWLASLHFSGASTRRLWMHARSSRRRWRRGRASATSCTST